MYCIDVHSYIDIGIDIETNIRYNKILDIDIRYVFRYRYWILDTRFTYRCWKALDIT